MCCHVNNVLPSLSSCYINLTMIYGPLQASQGCNWVISIVAQLPATTGRIRTVRDLRLERKPPWDKMLLLLTGKTYDAHSKAKCCVFVISFVGCIISFLWCLFSSAWFSNNFIAYINSDILTCQGSVKTFDF